MKGWSIFVHSVRLVFSNLDAAFKVSLVPYALSGLAFVFLGAKAMAILQIGTPEALAAAQSDIWTGLLIYTVVAVVAFLWIAVAWHRYVLLEEYPSGWMPMFHGSEMLSYFGRLVMIIILIFGVVMVASIVLGAALLLLGPAGGLLAGFVPFAIAYYVFYRLCPLLPAAAVGRPMKVSEAWKATAGSTSTIFVLVLLLLLLMMVSQLPNQIGGADTTIGLIYSLVIGWFMMLIGSSVLTTFYGHFVEGRDID